jgi:hypothetical protein
LLQHVKNGVTSQIQLQKILITELGCNVSASTVGRALAIATSKLLFNEEKGYNLIQSYCDHINLKGGYAHLDTVAMNQDEVAAPNEHFPSKCFIRSFISLQAQIQVAPYVKFACIDACHLSGKFKGMLICATTQDSNGTIFILAHALVPKENEDSWLYFLRHFKNAGLGNSITFFMSDRDKGLINAERQVFPEIPHSKCLRHLSENFKKKYGQQNSDILQHMARSYNAEDYQMFLDLLRTGESGEEINNWIHNADPNMWCRSLFPIPRFGITTSNPVEILFSALRNCRHYPALDLLLHLETYILSKRFEKWNKYQQMKMS